MKILVLTGSPHKHGTSALLADKFIEGALRGNHTVKRIDCGFIEVAPCIGCDTCVENNNVCIYKDQELLVLKELLEADMVVFATPIYYFSIPAQLKRVIDRFYAINEVLMSKKLKVVLMTTCGDGNWVTEPTIGMFSCMCKYLGWEMVGRLHAEYVYTLEDMRGKDYPDRAFQMGLDTMRYI